MSVAVWDAVPLDTVRSEHAEAPLWDAARGTLLWADQYVGIVREATLDPVTLAVGPVTETHVGGPVGAVVRHADGGHVLAARDGFVRLSGDGELIPMVDVLPADGIRRRMNDGEVDPRGRLWAGSMAFDKTPGAGALYLLDRGRATTVLEGVTISNGTAFSADGSEMLYIDTTTQQVRRFRVTDDDGSGRPGLADPEVVVEIDPADGHPDGMCVDDEGFLWVALWGGSEVRRYSPTGEHVGSVRVDAPQVSSCAFVGPDRDILLITTSQEGYSPEDSARHPRAGMLFAVRPGVTGPAASAYA
ncbi:SMP-30/gluconolactonase/LRE family protein [Clavibacter sp. VKM Ac-2542]|uniref:SMP-30/gluconolactonase/LRE family protein n=1 Tax=Clavibacter sp. VKM Ac-2542 TaxID=2783811 RepID=UPI00188DAE1D|nr:SMP-30/gluconolactonase/LRE family protein [Clavibacter sp. VKM Ac-2542]MBF4621140.1 SMP-30/gluconolactonase/LRE family protein [Clavibacter sp. VKM Ac-2542]